MTQDCLLKTLSWNKIIYKVKTRKKKYFFYTNGNKQEAFETNLYNEIAIFNISNTEM